MKVLFRVFTLGLLGVVHGLKILKPSLEGPSKAKLLRKRAPFCLGKNHKTIVVWKLRGFPQCCSVCFSDFGNEKVHKQVLPKPSRCTKNHKQVRRCKGFWRTPPSGKKRLQALCPVPNEKGLLLEAFKYLKSLPETPS